MTLGSFFEVLFKLENPGLHESVLAKQGHPDTCLENKSVLGGRERRNQNKRDLDDKDDKVKGIPWWSGG